MCSRTMLLTNPHLWTNQLPSRYHSSPNLWPLCSSSRIPSKLLNFTIIQWGSATTPCRTMTLTKDLEARTWGKLTTSVKPLNTRTRKSLKVNSAKVQTGGSRKTAGPNSCGTPASLWIRSRCMTGEGEMAGNLWRFHNTWTRETTNWITTFQTT